MFDLQRRSISAAIQTSLSVIGLAGVGVAPDNSGWQGEPNAAGTNFTPYSVIVPLPANTSEGPMGDPQDLWLLPYQVTSYGVSVEQMEWMADQSRKQVQLLNGQLITAGDNWRVIGVVVTIIGGAQVNTAVDPAYWGQSDVITFWASKE